MHEENQVQSEEAVKDTQSTENAPEAPVEAADQGRMLKARSLSIVS